MNQLQCKLPVLPPCNKYSASPPLRLFFVLQISILNGLKLNFWNQILCCLYPKAICEYLLFAFLFLSPYKIVLQEYSVLSKFN